MMKKLIILAILGLAVTGFAAAGGLVFHMGLGYHSTYIGDVSDVDPALSTLESMPLGIGAYAGVGYGFGDKKRLSLGAEFAPSWDFAVGGDPWVSNFDYDIRAFLKFKPMDIVTVTGFGGVDGSYFSGDVTEVNIPDNFTLGARVTVLFLYAEYAAVMTPAFDAIAEHEVGLGFALFK